ncbi:hypothetical protein XI05_09300 [Bradyrhizobium sp. CCBAU 11357]|nr:hypothetical protein [Bradyrhizobium sp. CCBAU 11357]
MILPFSGTFIKEVMALTASIPMVAPTADPVSFGFASSLSRPDRNFTGVVLDSGLEIWAKRVQLLLEVARAVTKIGYLTANPISLTPAPQGAGEYIREAAQRSGIGAAYVVVAGNLDRAAYERSYSSVIVGGEMIDSAACENTFEAMAREGVNGLIVSETSELRTHRRLIAELATRFRVPAIYPYRSFAEAGGLMSYALDGLEMMRRVANMTAQLLGGAKPSDIPFYRPTKYELVLNQKVATSIGLDFPPTLLTAADTVIE